MDGRRQARWLKSRSIEALRSAPIPMMKTTEHWLSNDLTDRLDLAGGGRVAIEGEMSPRSIVVVDVLAQHAAQMILAESDGVIGALLSDAADDAFDEGVLPRRSFCADNLLMRRAFAVLRKSSPKIASWSRWRNLGSSPQGNASTS